MAARARALVGTRFRPQGRRPDHGLDCVGLVALAADLAPELVPSGYSLRTEALKEARTFSIAGRVMPLSVREAGAGDVLLVQAGPCQSHLLILVEGGFVHADLVLGKVVETPGTPPWPAVAAWRVEEAA